MSVICLLVALTVYLTFGIITNVLIQCFFEDCMMYSTHIYNCIIQIDKEYPAKAVGQAIREG